MKKIIELAEKATGDNKDALSAYSSYLELKNALAEYKRLSETPITENWLTEHGWERSEIVFHGWTKTFEVGIREFATLILVNCYNKGWYVDYTPIRVNTIADLLDALELCGITID